MLCKYNNIFGEVGKGVHSYRIFDIAIIDVVLTIIVAYIIYTINPKYSFLTILLCLFILGIIFHRIFCVKTTIDKLHRPKRKMRQNVVMIYIFYNYVSNNLLNVLLLFYSLIYLL